MSLHYTLDRVSDSKDDIFRQGEGTKWEKLGVGGGFSWLVTREGSSRLSQLLKKQSRRSFRRVCKKTSSVCTCSLSQIFVIPESFLARATSRGGFAFCTRKELISLGDVTLAASLLLISEYGPPRTVLSLLKVGKLACIPNHLLFILSPAPSL